MAKDLSKIAKQKKIKYFLISFVDLFGVLRSKLVPARAIKEMQETGAGFAGYAAWLDMSPADSDMFGIPDPDSYWLDWGKNISEGDAKLIGFFNEDKFTSRTNGGDFNTISWPRQPSPPANITGHRHLIHLNVTD